MTSLNRRRFLGAAIGTGAAAATAGSWAPTASAQGGAPGRNRSVPNNRIGIQLYTMRRLMPEGDRRAVRRILNQIGAMGYTEVEMAGYWGFTAAQARTWLDAAGLRAVAGHDPLNIDPASTTWQDEYQQTLENANTLGQKYTGLAYFGPPYDTARFEALAERMNAAGELAKAAGLQFYYHNHNFEFENKQADGSPLFDILLEQTDPALVKFEMDLFWITEARANPLAYLSADPSRFWAYHVKDRTWEDRPDENDWEDVGPGSIDFPDIFAAGLGRPRTDKHYFVEHDWPPLSHPNDPEAELKTAQAGVTYLRNVKF